MERQVIARRPYNYLIIGHFHNAIPVMNGVITNGCLKGYDEYAYANDYPPNHPEQVWFSTDPKYGLTISAKVRCISSNNPEPWKADAPKDAEPDWMV